MVKTISLLNLPQSPTSLTGHMAKEINLQLTIASLATRETATKIMDHVVFLPNANCVTAWVILQNTAVVFSTTHQQQTVLPPHQHRIQNGL
jgi:hypothetical protein